MVLSLGSCLAMIGFSSSTLVQQVVQYSPVVVYLELFSGFGDPQTAIQGVRLGGSALGFL